MTPPRADARVLVVGSGGRETALARRLAASPRVEGVWVSPGSGGTDRLGSVRRAPVAADDHAGLVRLAGHLGADLVVVGPEAPLVAGLADALREAGLPVFGPGAAAARLEGSKAFAKAFMERHGIPTARAAVFEELDRARSHVCSVPYEVVVKASGLAGGKGVIVPESRQEALAALEIMLGERRFGRAGARVVVEERLRGREVSAMALCDGQRFALMPLARDHKPLQDGDRGPNTGGMGAVAPVEPGAREEIARRIIAPAIEGALAEGMAPRGALYAGLMITDEGPKVLEFNVRFGDPECQAVLPLLDGDLFEILSACARGRLDADAVGWTERATAVVVAVARGYPGACETGAPISGLDRAEAMEGVQVVEAATAKGEEGAQVSAGGRVLAVVGEAADPETARRRAYAGMRAVRFDGMRFRGDIGGPPTPGRGAGRPGGSAWAD